ncbi:hypothetical protein ACMAZF_16100 [Psychrobium sp. nBUS_13]
MQLVSLLAKKRLKPDSNESGFFIAQYQLADNKKAPLIYDSISGAFKVFN